MIRSLARDRGEVHVAFDPTKVTRTALENAASIAALLLTTEAMVVELPEPKAAAPAGGYGNGDGMY